MTVSAIYRNMTYGHMSAYWCAIRATFQGTGDRLVLYLESRTVAHRRAYVLLRRMGLRPRTHRAALIWELCGALGAGLAVAATTVTVLGFTLRGSLDVYPTKPPATVLTLPLPVLLAIVGCIAATAVGAALFAHRRIARASPAAVLRDAT